MSINNRIINYLPESVKRCDMILKCNNRVRFAKQAFTTSKKLRVGRRASVKRIPSPSVLSVSVFGVFEFFYSRKPLTIIFAHTNTNNITRAVFNVPECERLTYFFYYYPAPVIVRRACVYILVGDKDELFQFKTGLASLIIREHAPRVRIYEW